MYTDEYEKRTFPIRDFILKLILILIIVFLVIWLLPKFLRPNTSTVQDLSPLTSQIFADNLERMKEAAVSYYTDERLPQQVGDSDTMTLRDMIGKKLLIPFVDKNGEACEVDDSYVQITKMDDEYLMKVNLKCSDDEDYVLVHMGCYTYCEKAICAKEETKVSSGATLPSKTPSNVVPAVNNNNNGNDDVVPVEKPGSSKPSDPTPGTTNPNDPTPSDPTPSNPKPTDPTPSNPPKTEENMEYEYKKTTGAVMSNWSSWTPWALNSNGYTAVECSDKDPKCLKKVQLYSRKEQIGTYKKAYVSSRQDTRQYGSYQELACADYEYVRINETTYRTTKTYGVVTSITSSTQGSVGSWVYTGTVTTNVPPASTASTKYVPVGYDFECAGCSGSPKWTFKVYQYQGGLTNVTQTTTSTEKLLSSNTVKSEKTSINVSCSRVTTKTIPVYKTITVYDKAYKDEPLYGTVTYYSQKTRTLKEAGKTVTKWSDSANDKSLIAQGYYYTGNSRKK